jgi:glycosyltransferase involved in cell wall biosynthesis
MLVLFTGNVDWPQLDAILDLVVAVRDMIGVEFHIYSHDSQDGLVAMGVTGKNVVLHQGLPEDEARDRQAAADVLYLPMSFGAKGRHIIETAQPAKSVEYMASGVPVLVHAPAHAFVSRYAREHDIAIVVDQPGPDELRRALVALISDRTDAQRKATRAAALASKSYDSLEISHLLQSYLLHERG